MRNRFIGLGDMGGPMGLDPLKGRHPPLLPHVRAGAAEPPPDRGGQGGGRLQAVGDKVGYMGPIGAGTIAKLVHNMIGIATRAVFAEGFTLGVKAGVKPEALLEAIRGAAFGQGLMLSQMLPNVIFRGDFDTVRFALKLARKDIGLATELAREYDVPMPLAAVAEQIMVEAMARGWGDKDSTAPWMLQEEAAGVQVRERK